MGKTEENTIKLFETVDKRENLLGDWRLTIKISGRLGTAGFTAKLLDSYTDPKTGRARHYYDEHGNAQAGYLFDKPIVVFSPRTNRQDAHAVDFLLGHPKVFVEKGHGRLDEKYISAKRSNPKIKLVNLDHQDLDHLEDEDVIDKLIGRIVLEGGPQALSTLKIKWILASLNLTYIEDKYLMGTNAEKPKLRKRLKDFIRKGDDSSNAEKVNNILENLDEAKYIYQIKELLRFEILDNVTGHYKYNSHPISATTEGVVNYFKKNPDFYNELISLLSEKHKLELKK